MDNALADVIDPRYRVPILLVVFAFLRDPLHELNDLCWFALWPAPDLPCSRLSSAVPPCSVMLSWTARRSVGEHPKSHPDRAVSDFLLQPLCDDGSQPSGLGLAGSPGRRELDGDDRRSDPDGFECDITTPARVLQPDGERVVAELRSLFHRHGHGAAGLRVMKAPAAGGHLAQVRHDVLGRRTLVDILLRVLPDARVKVIVLGERHGAAVAQVTPASAVQPVALQRARRRDRLVVVPGVDRTAGVEGEPSREPRGGREQGL